jgi:hypothetical protein
MKWSDRVNWGAIPEHMRGGIIRYVENGVRPGHFLQAIFSNDLMAACARGDRENQLLLADYAKLLVNQCPGGCFGNATAFDEWVTRGGIEGNWKYASLPLHEWSRWADQEYK